MNFEYIFSLHRLGMAEMTDYDEGGHSGRSDFCRVSQGPDQGEGNALMPPSTSVMLGPSWDRRWSSSHPTTTGACIELGLYQISFPFRPVATSYGTPDCPSEVNYVYIMDEACLLYI